MRLTYFITAFFGRFLADLGIRSRSQTFGQFSPSRTFVTSIRGKQRLRVRVHGNELHTLQSGLNHAIHSVAAGPADSKHLNIGKWGTISVKLEHGGHSS